MGLGALAAAVVLATGCAPHEEARPAAQTEIDQKNICEVNAWQHDDVAAKCKPGQKVVFLPSTFGNAQLPILFVAVNCDMRYSVALTEGGVSCIYAPITPAPAEAPAPASAASK
jgi:hypothetical protein